MIEHLKQLEAAGVLAPIDVELARSLARIGAEVQPEVLLATALTSRSLHEGHVCFPLRTLAGKAILDDQGVPTGTSCPPLEAWLVQLQASPLVAVGTGDGAPKGRPLVLDAQGRLYLARYHDHERRVAEHIARLCARTVQTPPLSATLLARLFPDSEGRADPQRDAVLASRTRALSIIVGGPGTGKTTTVVRLLALLLEDARAADRRAPKILLAAPTGKAAQRLSEATGRALEKLQVDDAIKRSIPTAALTIHRALKAVPGASNRFQHDAENTLDCDVLLLDEASMVDLSLMRRLLDALPAHARLVMLGDPDQLAAVEAGGVLVDLCRAAQAPLSPLAGCLSFLRQSYRYAAESGVARLANAVHSGDADAALRVLCADLPDVHFSAAPLGKREALLSELARGAYAGLRASERDERLAALDQFRVLCAHRRGPDGVAQLNPALARAVHGSRSNSEHYAGRPLLITQNDYTSGLFNGDVGIEHMRRRSGPLCAYFRDETGGVRELSLARLPPHESVYAMTVHKSQGSEFDAVAVVLPEVASPVVSRELLFTAITRARRQVHLFGSEAVLRAAIAQRSQRHSGLVDLLLARGPRASTA